MIGRETCALKSVTRTEQMKECCAVRALTRRRVTKDFRLLHQLYRSARHGISHALAVRTSGSASQASKKGKGKLIRTRGPRISRCVLFHGLHKCRSSLAADPSFEFDIAARPRTRSKSRFPASLVEFSPISRGSSVRECGWFPAIFRCQSESARHVLTRFRCLRSQ